MTDLAPSFSRLNHILEGEVQTRLLHPRLTEALGLLSDATLNATLRALHDGTAGTGHVRIGAGKDDVYCELFKGHATQCLTVGALARSLIYERQWPQPEFSEEFLRFLDAPRRKLPYPRWQAQIDRQVRHLILTTDLMAGAQLSAGAAQEAVLTDEAMRLSTEFRLQDGRRVSAHPAQQA